MRALGWRFDVLHRTPSIRGRCSPLLERVMHPGPKKPLRISSYQGYLSRKPLPVEDVNVGRGSHGGLATHYILPKISKDPAAMGVAERLTWDSICVDIITDTNSMCIISSHKTRRQQNSSASCRASPYWGNSRVSGTLISIRECPNPHSCFENSI
jgi:hypothetical protein